MHKTYNTPLSQKLGIKEGSTLIVINSPANYTATLGKLPVGASVSKTPQTNSELIQFFAKSREELVKKLKEIKPYLSPAGALWISWPKKTSHIQTNLDESFVMGEGLKSGLVDVKVTKVDEDWSALKFVFRLKDR
ncbi:MAG TPA: hypothetical protein VLE91_02200 [Candidatus Saccharimonadales bacterium]|nr:hypothetical protein [Candidatus Saccharimonadales bacterium]